MKKIILGLLALSSVSAFADSSIGKTVIFRNFSLDAGNFYGYITGEVIAENEDVYVVRYVDGTIAYSVGTIREKAISKEKAGIKINCFNEICENDYVSNRSGRLSTKVEAVFDNGLVIGRGHGGLAKVFKIENVIKH
jgi:hypothetical protein